MVRILSYDVIFFSQTVWQFLINMIPFMTVYKSTNVSFLKILLLAIAISGIALMF